MNLVAAVGAMTVTVLLVPYTPNPAYGRINLVLHVVVGVCAYFLWGAQ